MPLERRKLENAALRELLNALKQFIAARDALWSLRFFDRLFRLDKCRAVFDSYDAASNAMRNAIEAVKTVTEAAADCFEESGAEEAGYKGSEDAPYPAPEPPLVSMEEFELLLGKPRLAPRSPQRSKAESIYREA